MSGLNISKSSINRILILIAFFIFNILIVSYSIAITKPIFLLIILMPLVLYFCAIKPFIFPFGLYLLLLPLDQILFLSDTPGGTTITKLLGLLSIVIFPLKGLYEKKIIVPRSEILWFFLFILYGSVSYLWALDQNLTMSILPTAIGLFILYIIMSSYKISEDEFNICCWSIIIGGIISTIYEIYSLKSPFYNSTKRATIALKDSTADPNTYAFSLLLPLSISLAYILKERKKRKKIFLIIFHILLLFGIVITGSRGTMIGALIVYSFFFLSIRKKFMMLVIAIMFCTIILSIVPSGIIDRWDDVLESGGSGRSQIWSTSIKILKQFWLVGAGLNNFMIAYKEFGQFNPFSSGAGRGSHNIYIGTFVELGFIGLTLLLISFIIHYRSITSQFSFDYRQIMLRASFWGILTSSLFLDTIWTKPFWLLWILMLMYKNLLRMLENTKEKAT